MAKLLAARAAWANADNALQVHGGNGYAENTPSAGCCATPHFEYFRGPPKFKPR